MWSFQFGLLFIRDLPSIKAAPFLYYTSVLISTKITTVLSLWDPYWTWLRGLTKLKDGDYLQAQHTSWSLVLLYGWNHGTFASPLEAPATFQFHIRFLCGSVLNRYLIFSGVFLGKNILLMFYILQFGKFLEYAWDKLYNFWCKISGICLGYIT